MIINDCLPTRLVAEEFIPDKTVLDALSTHRQYGMSDLFLWDYSDTPEVILKAEGPRTLPLEMIEAELIANRNYINEVEAEAASENAYGNGQNDETVWGQTVVNFQLELLNMVDTCYKGQLWDGNKPDQAVAWLFDYVDGQDEAAKKRYGDLIFKAIQKDSVIPDELPETPGDTIAQLLLVDSDHWTLRSQNYNIGQYRLRLKRLEFERMSTMALVRMVEAQV